MAAIAVWYEIVTGVDEEFNSAHFPVKETKSEDLLRPKNIIRENE